MSNYTVLHLHSMDSNPKSGLTIEDMLWLLQNMVVFFIMLRKNKCVRKMVLNIFMDKNFM